MGKYLINIFNCIGGIVHVRFSLITTDTGVLDILAYIFKREKLLG